MPLIRGEPSRRSVASVLCTCASKRPRARPASAGASFSTSASSPSRQLMTLPPGWQPSTGPSRRQGRRSSQPRAPARAVSHLAQSWHKGVTLAPLPCPVGSASGGGFALVPGGGGVRAYTRPAVGRSQVVRQRVLVPRSQVRILAPQPSIDPAVSDTPIAAVVMAAGLGTRMRSAVPKHLHPVLGRRMVDWVIAAARELGADPVVVVASPRTRDAFDGGVEVAVQEEPRGTGDAVRAARAALEGRADDVLVLTGDRPLLTAELLRELVETHRRDGRRGDGARRSSPPDARAYGRARARRRRARLARSSRPRDAIARGARARRGELLDLRRSAPRRLWPALERLEPQNAQGELYLTDAIGFLVEDGETVAAHVAADPVRGRGRQHAGRARRRGGRACATGSTSAHMLAGVTIVDPASTWIEPDVEIEPDVTIHPFVVPPRPHARRRRAPRSTRTPSRSTPRSGAARPSARSVTFAPGRSSRRIRRREPSWRSRTHGSGRERRCRTSRTSATPRSARTRTSAPARSPRTSRTRPAGRRAARRSAGTSGPGSRMASSPPSRSETEHGSPPDR